MISVCNQMIAFCNVNMSSLVICLRLSQLLYGPIRISVCVGAKLSRYDIGLSSQMLDQHVG